MCKWINRNFYKIAALALIAVVVLFSKGVISKATEQNEQLFYEDAKNLHSSSEYSDVHEAEVKQTSSCRTVEVQAPEPKTAKYSNSSEDDRAKKVFLYHLLCIVYICTLGVVITTLLIIILKDDNGIRYEKLDELHEIRKKFFAGEVNDSANKKETEDKFEKTTNMGKDSNINTKITETTKTNTTTEITDQRAELLKHYMNCVVEI